MISAIWYVSMRDHIIKPGKFRALLRASKRTHPDDNIRAINVVSLRGNVMSKNRVVHTSRTRPNGKHFTVEFDSGNREFIMRAFKDGVHYRVSHGWENAQEAIVEGNDEVDRVEL